MKCIKHRPLPLKRNNIIQNKTIHTTINYKFPKQRFKKTQINNRGNRVTVVERTHPQKLCVPLIWISLRSSSLRWGHLKILCPNGDISGFSWYYIYIIDVICNLLEVFGNGVIYKQKEGPS